ncbi:MAG TPA: hypothetical protein VFR33_08720 [Candidatus Dormibacteraeota bacterium]|nr:hypothetical protein [Candidatus Dormibacteraeota bacterium]
MPTVPQIGADLKCSSGDHGYSDEQLGWGFCYPSSWRYQEKVQATDSPTGVDLTFEITCLTDCKPQCPTPASGQPATCAPEPGLFGFMIVSTYDRAGASDLNGWLATKLPRVTRGDPIEWGNALEAAQLSDGRRVALTPHNVVVLDVHPSLLDLDGEMSSRLGTWKFTY